MRSMLLIFKDDILFVSLFWFLLSYIYLYLFILIIFVIKSHLKLVQSNHIVLWTRLQFSYMSNDIHDYNIIKVYNHNNHYVNNWMIMLHHDVYDCMVILHRYIQDWFIIHTWLRYTYMVTLQYINDNITVHTWLYFYACMV